MSPMGEVDPRVKEQQRQWHKEVGSVDANLILIIIITTVIKKERQRQGKYLQYMQYSICSTNSTYKIPMTTRYSPTSNSR